MKLASFITPDANETDGIKFSVSGSSYQLEYYKDGAKVGKSMVIDESWYQPKTKYIILWSPLLGLLRFDHDWLFKSKSNWGYIKDAHFAQDVVANVYFHDSYDNGVIFINSVPICEPTGFIHPKETPIRVHDYIATLFPADEDKVAYNTNLRIATLTEVSDIDSIVALEQQVDLLTKLVQSMMNGEAAPEWATSFMAAVNDNAVDGNKTVDDCISNIGSHKSTVRAAQKAYLDQRR